MGTVTYANPSFESETTTLVNSFSSAPTLARKMIIDSLIKNLKAGVVWSKLDVFYVFAAADANASLKNWKNPGTFDATNVNATTFAADIGYTGNGSNMSIDSNFNPSTAGGSWSQNSACLFAWSNTNASGANPAAGQAIAGFGTVIYPKYSDNGFYTRINNNTTNSSGSVAQGDPRGLSCTSRTASALTTAYFNGQPGGFTDTTASVATDNSNVHALRGDGGTFGNQQVCAIGAGGALEQRHAYLLYIHVRNYMNALGVFVP